MSYRALSSIVASVLVVAVAQAQSPDLQSIKPDQIKWSQHPALPKGNMRAVVYGDPTKPGPYVNRLRQPQGTKIMPHTHPDDRIYTVLSGTLWLGMGDTWDETKLVAYPQGTVIYMPAKLSHFQSAKSGEYEIQINGAGPTDLTFINPADDLAVAEAQRHRPSARVNRGTNGPLKLWPSDLRVPVRRYVAYSTSGAVGRAPSFALLQNGFPMPPSLPVDHTV